jgi:hypothetical protein
MVHKQRFNIIIGPLESKPCVPGFVRSKDLECRCQLEKPRRASDGISVGTNR